MIIRTAAVFFGGPFPANIRVAIRRRLHLQMFARCFVLLLSLAASGLATGQGYHIDRFSVEMELHANGYVDVVERIQVTFDESKRGIFRFVPTDLPTGKGLSRRIFLFPKKVTDENGAVQPTKISREGANMKIRVGDPEIWYPPGTTKIYVFRYTAFGMINWFDEDKTWEPSAELYWNLTGNETDTTVAETDFIIHTPPVEASRVRAKVMTGSYGSTGQRILGKKGGREDLEIAWASNSLAGRRTSPMAPGEGLTVVLSLPANLIKRPGLWDQAKLVIGANPGFLIPVVVLLCLIPLWIINGRDPAGGPMVVQFEPPDGMSGPEAGTMIDERVDRRDLAAGFISLAVKGFLTLDVKEEGMIFKSRSVTLTLTGKGTGSLSQFEQLLLQKLGSAPGTVITASALRTHVAPHIPQLRASLYESLTARGFYLRSPEMVRIAWLVGGLLVVAGLGVLGALISPLHDVLPSVIGGVIGAVIVWLFSRGMPRRTKVGSLARMKVIGFAEFIKRARSDELDWMSKKHPDQALFEEYLPHAVAFGLTREWTEAFRNFDIQMPDWYHGNVGYWNPIWFANDLGAATDTITQSALTPPRSEGASGGNSGWSGGGGFSGGGFGGGGVGSW